MQLKKARETAGRPEKSTPRAPRRARGAEPAGGGDSKGAGATDVATEKSGANSECAGAMRAKFGETRLQRTHGEAVGVAALGMWPLRGRGDAGDEAVPEALQFRGGGHARDKVAREESRPR